jgi:hypothetical protein
MKKAKGAHKNPGRVGIARVTVVTLKPARKAKASPPRRSGGK